MAEPSVRRRLQASAAAAASGETPTRASSSSVSSNDGLDPLAALCIQMEEINDKLKLLDYENQFIRARPALALKPLHRCYFALQIKPSEQFPYFSHLMAWLLSLCGREVLEWNEFDDPNTISASIIQQLAILGASHELQPVKLRHGSGDQVLTCLDFMTSKALKHLGFSPQQPDYRSSPLGSAAPALPHQGTELDEDDDEIVDMIEDENLAFDAEESGTNDAFTSVSMIAPAAKPITQFTAMDSAAWMLEVERVANQLKLNASAGHMGSLHEWRARRDMLTKHRELLHANIPPVQKDLDRMSNVLGKALERIAHKEKSLNRDHESLATEMRDLQREYEHHQSNYASLSAELSSLNEKYTERTTAVEEAKERIDQRNAAMMDATPVRIMQQTVKSMKQEILEMEVKIGIVSQCLHSAQQRQWALKAKAASREERDRQRKGVRGFQPHARQQQAVKSFY